VRGNLCSSSYWPSRCTSSAPCSAPASILEGRGGFLPLDVTDSIQIFYIALAIIVYQLILSVRKLHGRWVVVVFRDVLSCSFCCLMLLLSFDSALF
jgi:hypothetical protein